jgi:N-methylhydantoinase A/oxoprolinase/acetone carboxylase beta subunit
MIKNGIPKRSLNTSDLGGVKLNFSMPDVLSIAIGGGSRTIIDLDGNAIIGPESVSKDLCEQACSFGGNVLTLTDAALRAGSLSIKGAMPEKVQITDLQASLILKTAIQKIKHFVSIMAGNKEEFPVLLVGGGAALFPIGELGSRFVIPPYAHVANAYGSALAEIVGTADKVVSLRERNAAIEKLQEEAIAEAILRGADPQSIRISDLEIIPYHYTSDQMARVIVSASGKHHWNDALLKSTAPTPSNV